MRRYGWLVVGVVVLALWAWQRGPTVIAPAAAPAVTPAAHADTPPAAPPLAQRAPPSPVVAQAGLPPEALATLQRIERGGPHAYRQDGGNFQNRERLLPSRPRGYYREYTVETPGSRDRGARRIVTGGGIPGKSAPTEFFYSDDHYRSFRRIDAGRQQ
jgi:guanyl-specific ribonuclease Sa